MSIYQILAIIAIFSAFAVVIWMILYSEYVYRLDHPEKEHESKKS